MRIEAYNQIQQIYNDSKLKKTQSVSKTGKTDQVEISSLGKDIQTAKKAVTQTPDVRTELTDPLKKQVQDGTYDVDGMTFAERLLEKYDELSWWMHAASSEKIMRGKKTVRIKER